MQTFVPLKETPIEENTGTQRDEIPDQTKELKPADASIYRTCTGILLYLSADLPQCQYVIRYLSTFSSKPTEKSMAVPNTLLGIWQRILTNAYPCDGKGCMLEFSEAMRMKSQSWRFTVMLIGLQTVKPEGQSVVPQCSLVDAFCTQARGLRKS